MGECPGTYVLSDGRRCELVSEGVETNILTVWVVTQCSYTCVDAQGRQSAHMVRRKRLLWFFSWFDE